MDTLMVSEVCKVLYRGEEKVLMRHQVGPEIEDDNIRLPINTRDQSPGRQMKGPSQEESYPTWYSIVKNDLGSKQFDP